MAVLTAIVLLTFFGGVAAFIGYLMGQNTKLTNRSNRATYVVGYADSMLRGLDEQLVGVDKTQLQLAIRKLNQFREDLL